MREFASFIISGINLCLVHSPGNLRFHLSLNFLQLTANHTSMSSPLTLCSKPLVIQVNITRKSPATTYIPFFVTQLYTSIKQVQPSYSHIPR